MEADRPERPTRGRWPRHPVIYQIYPRSFRDTTGSGEGDLRGVTEKLDHVASLGVDAIWLSPFFPSPMCDGGYDVSDHRDVDPRFGTLEDFDALVARAHDLGLLVMIDQVFNHTSDQHDWFARSAEREPPYEDFYTWLDPSPDGCPPSNWIGFFGRPAWKWNHRRKQYCLHQFLPCQPCLNHHCPELRARQSETMRFWRDRGVDGFRFDAVTAFFNDKALRDNPPREHAGEKPMNPFGWQWHEHDMMPNDCAAYSAELRDAAGSDAYLLGEVNGDDTSMTLVNKFAHPDRLDAAYTTRLAESGTLVETLCAMIDEGADNGGLAWWLSSHDQPRHVSRAGDGSARDARMFAAVLLALPGPLMLFQGDEIGQPQARLRRDQHRDPFDKSYWPETAGRDGARAPIVWDSAADDAGFGATDPWLPYAPAEEGGVAQQARREDSVLGFHRRALALRRETGLAEASMTIEDRWEGGMLATLETSDSRICLCLNETRSACPLPGRLTGAEPILASAPVAEDRMPPRSAAWWCEG